jgi:hypothetical protein
MAENKKVRALIVPVHQEPSEIMIENNFREMQKLVGGYIEYFQLDGKTNAVLNEEGKINGMEGNRLVGNEIICGDFLVVGDNGMGESASLTDEQVSKYMEVFKTPLEFTKEQVEENIHVTVMSFEDYEKGHFFDPRPKVDPKVFKPRER